MDAERNRAIAGVLIVPNPTTLPVISDISSEEITPGAILTITGSNFGNTPGEVTFTVRGREIDGNIDEWTSTFVSVSMPSSVTGLKPSSNCEVTLETNRGNSTTQTIDFVPRMSSYAVTEFVPARSGGTTEMTYRMFNFELLNGWTTGLSGIEWEGSGIPYIPSPFPGASPPPGPQFEERPSYGSTSPYCEVAVRPYTDGGYPEFEVYVMITGPAGIESGAD